MIKVQTLKGFRDFLPGEARKRQYVINKLKEIFESFGFDPLETPALEYEEVLLGKYGDEGDKLMYRFTDNGGRKVALRYDQTVPLARVVAEYSDKLPTPFKRYQTQNVWRAENTQKGRYREFLQCDADIVGISSYLADAEILSLVLEIYKTLGLDIIIKINDRSNFENLDKKYVAAIDKLEKIGVEGVIAELTEKGLSESEAKETLDKLQNKPVNESLKQILNALEMMGQDVTKVVFDPTLARGLNYYTGLIFETVAKGSSGSICSGGRYDNLIGQLGGKDEPAVGFGLGFDRTLEVMEEQGLLPTEQTSSKVLVTIFSIELLPKSIATVLELDKAKINCELWLDPISKLDKQLKYADQKEIPFAIIIGPEEAEKGQVTLKDLKNKTQQTISLDEVVQKLI